MIKLWTSYWGLRFKPQQRSKQNISPSSLLRPIRRNIDRLPVQTQRNAHNAKNIASIPLKRLNITNPSLEGKFSALRTLRLHTKHNTPSSVRLQYLSRARLCACLQALLRTGSEVSSKLRRGFPSECHVQRLILWSTIPSILANFCRVFSFNFC